MAANTLSVVRNTTVRQPPAGSSASSLEQAFAAFNQLSGELSETYQALEAQVRQLTSELEQANAERLQQLSEKERIARRLQKLLQLLPGGVLVLSARGQIAECNAAAEDLLGKPLDGELWVDIIRERFAPRSDDGHEISLVNGKRVSLLSRSLEEEPGQIILITDQTETRQLQQSLSRHQRLTEMGQMVSSLAHQIRTPLAAAMLYAGHLAQGQEQLPSQPQGQVSVAGKTQPQLWPLDAERFARTHERLMSRLHNMERQVRDMLVFARGEGILDQTLSMTELFEETRLAAEVLLRPHATHCVWENRVPHCDVNCNMESLVGAVLNLLENSLQNGGPQVTLRVCADHECQPGFMRFFVQDNGPGIDPSKIHQVTEAFYTTRAQGTGLGLAVAQVVARAHGGQFFIENLQHADSAGASGVRAGFVLPCLGNRQKEQAL
jgi:two-component system sensor histidine kinase FlrB